MSTTAEKFQEEQDAYWNGEGGQRWLAAAESTDRTLINFTNKIEQVAAARARERVIDVGCGTGATSRRLAEAVGPEGHVLGVDIATPLIEIATKDAHAAGLSNTEFKVSDATVFDFAGVNADLMFSRFGVMFFGDPNAAFANLRNGMKSGGRLAFVCWQPLPKCEFFMLPLQAALELLPAPEAPPPGTPGPFAFGDPDRTRGILEGAGFVDVALDPFEANMELAIASDFSRSVEMITGLGPVGRMLTDETEDMKAKVKDLVGKALQSRMTDEGIQLKGAVWVVTAKVP